MEQALGLAGGTSVGAGHLHHASTTLEHTAAASHKLSANVTQSDYQKSGPKKAIMLSSTHNTHKGPINVQR